MGKFFYSEDSPPPIFISSRSRPHHRHYGMLRFLFDCFMTFVTAGLWLIWIFVREMRAR